MATLVVHLVPRARRTEVSGRHGDAIKKARAELVRFVAVARALLRTDPEGEQA